jgi:hypothetical protein
MRIIISTFFIALSIIISAQEDVARNMITKTEVSIFKSQKEMLVGHVQNKQAALSNAIRYQVLAVKEFNKSNFSIAMCYSSKAREYTTEILSDVPNLSGLDYYLLTNEEKQMRVQNNCAASETEIPVLISDAVLMNPDQLRSSYKISLN